jgi:hypothetical protein
MGKKWYLRDPSSYIYEDGGTFIYGYFSGGQYCFHAQNDEIKEVKEALEKMCRGYGVFLNYFTKVAKEFGHPVQMGS